MGVKVGTVPEACGCSLEYHARIGDDFSSVFEAMKVGISENVRPNRARQTKCKKLIVPNIRPF